VTVPDPGPRAEAGRGHGPEERFLDLVWWVSQEVLHHGAEMALLRDLYRDQP
jgi:hypothetical protein